MVPTLLDLLDLLAPSTLRGVTQSPLQGVSFAHTLEDPGADSHHHTQYFEMLGHRAIYHDGWRAVCPWPGPSFAEAGKYGVMPVDGSGLARIIAEKPLVSLPRDRYTCRPHTQSVPFFAVHRKDSLGDR